MTSSVLPGRRGASAAPGSQALRNGRRAVDRHLSRASEAGWCPVAATGVLLDAARPQVRRWRCGPDGAGWLWWFVDGGGTAFGALARPAALRRTRAGWRLDRPGDDLVQAAEHLGVPAVDLLFCRDRAHRSGLDCGIAHYGGAHCRGRKRAGVSVVPGLVAEYLAPRVGPTLPGAVFHWSLPLEDVARADRPQPPLRPSPTVRGCVADFLAQPQSGARQVAKALVEPLHLLRLGQFSAALADYAQPAPDGVFTALPTDRALFSVPYLAHVLRGLRRRPPAYAADLLAGRAPGDPPNGVGGVAVIRL
ncbi:hypothetical protein [Actinokineospora bangkokensis]|uniref:Uncharacterized protein n=1 Tax=Actinokineospora bangkokensis TaxID=1193682 RepID=A0A1Q9LN92_9PSEU|nr:hypothetical protein [Actinokineospora bangkokensis]OLR93485.1 hypothetical protein BJP25_14355 [Actinokineospora bangkokensis]